MAEQPSFASNDGKNEQKIQELMNELEKTKSLLVIKKQECDEYVEQIKQIKETNKTLLNERDEYKQGQYDQEITTKTLQSELKGLLTHLESNDDNLNQLNKVLNENVKLKTEQKLLNEALNSIKNDNEMYIKQNNELNENILDSNKRCNYLNQTNLKLKHQTLSLKQALKDKSDECIAMESDLTSYENQINELKKLNLLLNNDNDKDKDNDNNNKSSLLFSTKRRSIQQLYATRLLTAQQIDESMSNIDLMKEHTPSNPDQLSPSLTPPAQLYDHVMNTNYSINDDDHNNNNNNDEQEEREKLEQKIRKQVEDAYQEKFDAIVNGKGKYENTFLFFLCVLGLLFISWVIIIGVMGRDKMLCYDKCDCAQGLVDQYVNCDEPPTSKLHISLCPI